MIPTPPPSCPFTISFLPSSASERSGTPSPLPPRLPAGPRWNISKKARSPLARGSASVRLHRICVPTALRGCRRRVSAIPIFVLRPLPPPPPSPFILALRAFPGVGELATTTTTTTLDATRSHPASLPFSPRELPEVRSVATAAMEQSGNAIRRVINRCAREKGDQVQVGAQVVTGERFLG